MNQPVCDGSHSLVVAAEFNLQHSLPFTIKLNEISLQEFESWELDKQTHAQNSI